MIVKRTAVLLANLGSPTAPTTKAVRRFLKDFLWDPRVVNIPRPIWWLILHGFVLPFRPSKSAKLYQAIWHPEKGSPLSFYTQQLSQKLSEHLSAEGVIVEYAMRYGEPSLATQLKRLQAEKVENIIVLPLYPQYSSTTTASIYDDLIKELNQWRHIPAFQFISDYHQHSDYIAAVAASIEQAWRENGKHELLVMSFHGLPEVLTEWGDPYFDHCQTTGRLIAEKLGLSDKQWQLVFQSRFGKAEWLKPYCADTLSQLPGQGIKTVDVVCPGFAVDCLETLEEIVVENKAIFMEAGGTAYHYIPALNDSTAHVEMLLTLLKNKL